MTIVTESCKVGAPGQGCPGSIVYDLAERRDGSIEFCDVCDAGHEWDDQNDCWRIRIDLRLARLESD